MYWLGVTVMQSIFGACHLVINLTKSQEGGGMQSFACLLDAVELWPNNLKKNIR